MAQHNPKGQNPWHNILPKAKIQDLGLVDQNLFQLKSLMDFLLEKKRTDIFWIWSLKKVVYRKKFDVTLERKGKI